MKTKVLKKYTKSKNLHLINNDTLMCAHLNNKNVGNFLARLFAGAYGQTCGFAVSAVFIGDVLSFSVEVLWLTSDTSLYCNVPFLLSYVKILLTLCGS